MTVRTKQLYIGRASAGGVVDDVYTVPAGRTTILKDISVGNEGTVAVLCAVIIVNAANSEAGDVFYESVLGSSGVQMFGRFIVLEPGDVLQTFASSIATGAVRFLLSGAELDGVA